MKNHVAPTISRYFRQLRLLKDCIKSLPFDVQQEQLLQPLLHRKSIGATVCWLVRLNAFWIACSLSSMLLPGCCAIIESTITLHRSSVMFFLHWLPVPLCIEYKVCLLVYKSLHGAAPGYLRDYSIKTRAVNVYPFTRLTDRW